MPKYHSLVYFQNNIKYEKFISIAIFIIFLEYKTLLYNFALLFLQESYVTLCVSKQVK